MYKKLLLTFAILLTISPISMFAQSSTDSVRTQLDQIDNIQSKVTNFIPANIQEKISGWLLQLNTWREKLSWYYLGREGEIDHQLNVEALVGTQFDPNATDNNSDTTQKPEEKKGIREVIGNIWQYGELAFFSFMAFIFANKYVFYVFAVFIVLICLRVIYKLIFH